MTIGLRQNEAFFTLTADTERVITFDQQFFVRSMQLLDSDGTGAITHTVRVTAEGEALWNGEAVPIWALCIKTDNGAAAGTAHESPYLYVWEDPIEVSRKFPFKITVSGDEYYLVLRGPQGTGRVA